MILANKQIGETPLELINRLRKENKISPKAKATYAGRLDPLASGLMIILEDNEVYDKQKFISLEKEYNLDIVFGIQTDTYDPMGIITNISIPTQLNNIDITNSIHSSKKLTYLPYPIYSSKTVNGIPLWKHTKNDNLNNISIPYNNFEIYSIHINYISKISMEKFVNEIISQILSVKGNFRQKEIINNWSSLLQKHSKNLLQIANINIICSSGTYARSVANQIGINLGKYSIAYNIKRTKIGNFSLINVLDKAN